MAVWLLLNTSTLFFECFEAVVGAKCRHAQPMAITGLRMREDGTTDVIASCNACGSIVEFQSAYAASYEVTGGDLDTTVTEMEIGYEVSDGI